MNLRESMSLANRNSRAEVVQIVPQPSRTYEGVSSYASVLGAALRSRGLSGHVVVGENHGRSFAEIPGATAVLLHYVNYGYQRRGCPGELVAGAVSWRARSAGCLVTIFHELYAFGPPWTSSFWLSPVQRRLAAALARGSDVCVTTTPLYSEILRSWVGAGRVVESAAFSTVGEPLRVAPLADRRRRLVVFGSAGVRERAYREVAALEKVIAALSITEILDIGEHLPDSRRPVLSIPWRALGQRPAAEVGNILGNAVAGFLSYPPALLGKSTIFAAYCAHGMLPLYAHANAEIGTSPGWNARLHLPETTAELQAIADRARAWYEAHSAEVLAASLSRSLSQRHGDRDQS